jgi:tetratricopeptide (TPR) repeat protein
MSNGKNIPKTSERICLSVFQRYRISRLVGLALVAMTFLVWIQWSAVSPAPRVSSLIEDAVSGVLPQADPNRFSVAVAHLEDDDAYQSHKKLIIRLLQSLDGVEVLAFDRTIRAHDPVAENQDHKGHQTARRYLNASNASVLIWGRVTSNAGQSIAALSLTAAQGGRASQDTPEIDMGLRLPAVSWEHLSDVLSVVIATQAAQFEERHSLADRLQPFIARVHALLDKGAGRPGWDAEARASTRSALANALLTLGGQSGLNKPLEDAVAVYEEALKEWTRERVPLDWAMTQNNMGAALATLGERESGTARLERAVAAYRAALEEYTRERVPLDWARTQNSLGEALAALGERENGYAPLLQAAQAYRAALEEYVREQVTLDSAMTQNNLNIQLATFGEHDRGAVRLEQAIEAYRAALKERTREKVPLDWAATQTSLGDALAALGAQEDGTALLEQAVEAYRAALEERTRERVPLDWAATQTNLSLALTMLCMQIGDRAKCEEAREALNSAF